MPPTPCGLAVVPVSVTPIFRYKRSTSRLSFDRTVQRVGGVLRIELTLSPRDLGERAENLCVEGILVAVVVVDVVVGDLF